MTYFVFDYKIYTTLSMNLLGLRITIIVLCFLLLIFCILMMCKNIKKVYFKLIIFSVVCFIISTLYLTSVFAFARENNIEHSLFLFGIIAGFSFYIVMKNLKDDSAFEVTPKNKTISFLFSLVLALTLTSVFIIYFVNNKTSINVTRLILSILVFIMAIVTIYFLLGSILSSLKKQEGIKRVIKGIDLLLMIELALGSGIGFCVVFNNLFAMGILILIFILIQCAILYLVYRGNKYE